MSKHERRESEWKFDEHGNVSNRALAEMIVSSLFYAKPPVISDADFDRAVDIAEEEINVVEIQGKERVRRAHTSGSQQGAAGNSR